MNNWVIYEGDWQFPVRKEFVLDPSISVGAKMLYIALKSYCAPNQSVSFPSSKTLAKALGVSVRSIWNWANELEDKNLLRRSQERASGGAWTHTLWKIIGSNAHEHI